MSKLSRAIDILVLIASFIFIILLVLVLSYSLIYWENAYNLYGSMMKTPEKLYTIGILIAVITSLAQWIEGRIKYIIRFFESEKEVEYNGIKTAKENRRL